MSQASDGFELRDSLIALPKRVLPLLALIPFLSTGVGIYLVATDNSESVRTAAILLITLSAPAFTVAVGLAAAVRVGTKDIDRLITTWLSETVAEKLNGYLVGAPAARASRLRHPPLFSGLEAIPDASTSSYCLYELTDSDDRPYFLYVKSNIINVELGIYVALAGVGRELPSNRIRVSDLSAWEKYLDDPRVSCCADAVYGSICEGYQLYIASARNPDGPYVAYRLRQKLDAPFITSPYMRRYVAEDLAIMAYAIFAEITSAKEVAIAPTRGPLRELPS
jgi:hypothetical protein